MKLKGLSNRLYNITFHTHTVSGIVISFALYVIFFAGAFTLFKAEFYQWENPDARQPITKSIDYDGVIASLKKEKPLFDLSEDMTLRLPSEREPRVGIYGHLITGKGKPEQHYETIYSPQSRTFSEEKTTIGETLYRLHFFDQIPVIGRFISGFVALFFAFAVITGVMIHWQNILTRFNGFSLKGSLKNIWTNSHTVFGLLGLPFQFMYAITGAYYMLSFLVLLPVVVVFFGGDQQKALKVIYPAFAIENHENASLATHNLTVNSVLNTIKDKHPELEFSYLQIKHYDRQDATLLAGMKDNKSFTGDGTITISLHDGKTLLALWPNNKGYAQSVLPGIARLHFATFGGITLKIIYAVLSLFTCFVIISGVLLWKEARNKKNYTDKQKRFHQRVTISYLAICFGLFPAVAVLFSAELLVPDIAEHILYVKTAFFGSWLLFTIVGLFLKNEGKVTQLYLLLGGISSLAVPLANGIMTGDWLWATLAKANYYVAGTDLFWLLTGLVSLALTWLMNKKSKEILEPVSEKSLKSDTFVKVKS